MRQVWAQVGASVPDRRAQRCCPSKEMALSIEAGVISATDRGGEGILDRQWEASWGESEFKSFIHPFGASRTDVVLASSGHSELKQVPPCRGLTALWLQAFLPVRHCFLQRLV